MTACWLPLQCRCCGDIDHIDLAKWSFEKLAELRWGVIPLRYRPVPCDYKPYKQALPLKNPSPPIPLYPPAGEKDVPGQTLERCCSCDVH